VHFAQGDLPAALKSYRNGLAIAERLAQSDPGNAGWQRDLLVFRTTHVRWQGRERADREAPLCCK
jgi:hypothetical protein